MTDWLRVLAYSILGVALLLGLSTLVWWRKFQHQLGKFRDQTVVDIQESQRGRRPMWHADPSGKERERRQTTLRPELGVLPERIARLQLDARGYPVPWFVQWIDGKPEFRVMDAVKFARAVKEKRCWVCGDLLGAHLSFVIGPMCALNRTNSEPPCHHECAVWSAQHCPFLTRPHMVRREDDFTDTCRKGDAAIMRNPGCAAVWTTRTYRLHRAPRNAATDYLFEMGEPERIEWFAEGRRATRAEVEHSIDTGVPLLEAVCDRERTPMDWLNARTQLGIARTSIERWLPTAAIQKAEN